MPLNHPIEQEELMAYLDGELYTDRASAVATHLEGCDECRKIASDLRQVTSALQTWRVEPAARPDIGAALDDRAAKRSGTPRRRLMWSFAWGLAGLFVVVSVMSVSVRQPLLKPPVAQFGDAQVSLYSTSSVPRRSAVEFAKARNPMIMYRTELSIVTKDFGTSRGELEAILKRHGGYLGDLVVKASPGSGRYLEATLRVPANQLEAVMTELRALGHVDSESQTGEDVTQQSVDLDARLSNARNSERRLVEILREKTGKLGDVLDVEKEVERVRGEIEAMEAERKSLTNRVEFATLNVKLVEEARAENQMPGSISFRLRNAAIEGYRTLAEGLTGAVLFLLAYAPSTLFWSAVLFFPARFIWRRLRHRLLHSL
jgi:hypothetical protein